MAEKENKETKRRLPAPKLLPEFDLGALADDDDESADKRAEFEQWRGWVVVYRADRRYASLAGITNASMSDRLMTLRTLIHTWNFVDEDGEPLPQPTKDNWRELVLQLPDSLIMALLKGFLAALDIPKATTSS